jgi:arylformamidase
MEIFDVSQRVVPGMFVWPGDPPVEVRATARVRAGDPANVSELRLGTHTGTHVDPPAHFFDGTTTVDALPLDVLIGDALVVDVSGRTGPLGPAELERAGAGPGAVRLLLRTGAGPGRDGPALSEDGARWVVGRGIRLVGIDAPSIEAPAGRGHPVHEVLLQAGVVIVEGLDLSAVSAGGYELVCLPLKVTGGDGAPARAVLIRRR